MTVVEVLSQAVVDIVPDMIVMQGIVLPQSIDAVVMIVERRVGRLMMMGQECGVPHVLMIGKTLLPVVMQPLVLEPTVRQGTLSPMMLQELR